METFALSEPVLLVLLSLAEQPRHGYSILKDVESMSGGRVLLSTGTLYGALQRLLDNGWIERVEELCDTLDQLEGNRLRKWKSDYPFADLAR